MSFLKSNGFSNDISAPKGDTSSLSTLLDMLIPNINRDQITAGWLLSDATNFQYFLVFERTRNDRDQEENQRYYQPVPFALGTFRHAIDNFDWSSVTSEGDVNKAYAIFLLIILLKYRVIGFLIKWQNTTMHAVSPGLRKGYSYTST